MIEIDKIYNSDCFKGIKSIDDNSIELILSDIPYGISYEDWDVLHNNTNSALLGTSPAQEKGGTIFKKRGKPLNGWSEADKEIPREYYDWVSTWVEDWFRVLKPGASAFVFAGRRMSHRCTCAFEDAGFIFKDMIAWNKEKAAHRAQRVSCVFERRNDIDNEKLWKGWKVGNLRPIFEPILWFMKPYKIGGTLVDNINQYGVGAYNETSLDMYKLYPNNLISIASSKDDVGLHPTQKPLKLMEVLISLTTIENQIVLDPFAGSGTTLVAAQRLNRHFIGFENQKKYYDAALQRLATNTIEMQQSLF
jgi:site-specific DNA-methyltransferase (adenine-specific)